MSIKEILKRLKLAESTISMVLGALVVIVIGVLLFNYFRGIGRKIRPGLPEEEIEIEVSEEMPEAQPTPIKPLPATYKTVTGDHLWKIAEKFYGSGYNWVDIAEENNVVGPNLIAVGQELNIPGVPVRQSKTRLPETGVAKLETITGSTYTVVKGDNLWDIAVRTYQDGFKWPEIAQANDLANPDIIHPGNILELPR